MRYETMPHASILPPTPKVFEEYKATTPKPILEHRNHTDNPCIHSPCYPIIYSMVFKKKYIENNNTMKTLSFQWYLINLITWNSVPCIGETPAPPCIICLGLFWRMG